jgi:hypothetical protein
MFVVLSGKAIYCGRPDDPAAEQRYHQAIAEWMAAGRQAVADPDALTVKELLARFWLHAEQYYRTETDFRNKELEQFKLAFRPLKELYSDLPAIAFGPRSLKAVQGKMVQMGWSRKYVNKQVNRIRQAFKWSVGDELLPGSVLEGLRAVPGLKRGRTDARELPPVKPAPMKMVVAIKPFVSRQVWAMVQLQFFTAARPGEIIRMQPSAIDCGNGADDDFVLGADEQSGDDTEILRATFTRAAEDGKHIWVYRMDDHKTAHHGFSKKIWIGPRAQQVLAPFLLRAPQRYCFSPVEAMVEWRKLAFENRQTPADQGNSPGTNRKEKPKWTPGQRYTTSTYRLANAIGAVLAPTLTELAGVVGKYLVMAADWLRQNKELVLTIFKVAAGVVAAGLALVGLGYVLIGLAKAVGVLVTVCQVVHTVLAAVVSVIAFMLSPIGLVIAAVVALAGYILYASGAGGKALSWLGERFNELKEDALAAFGGISDALAAGDIGLAAKILWLTLKMEWQKGVNWISSIWNEALLWLKQRATEAFYGTVMILETIWHGLEVAWIETTAFLSGVWTNFCAGIQQAWMWVSKSLEQTWNKLKGVFDSSFNADAANSALEGNYQAARDQMWNQAKQQLGERDAQRARERAEEAQTHNDTMGNLLREGEEAKTRQQKEYEDKLAGNQAELDGARKEWQDAIAAAKDKRKAKEAQGPDATQSPDDILAKAQKQLGGLDDLMDATAKRTVGVRGTFNALEASGLGSGSAVDRIASATEATAQNTASLVKKAGNGLAFTR